MKDITKLIRRFVGILLLSTVLVIVLNIIILAAISASQTANGRPWTTAKETAEALQKTETGYILSGDMTERLSGENAWAIYIDNDTLEVKWHTENLPDIELLAPIARLLDISLDTLLSFHEKLSDTEIEEIIRKMDRMFSEEGYEKTYEWALRLIKEYPNCNMLIWQTAVMLDARRITDKCTNQEKYDKQINAWYELALHDENEEIQHHAADSLFGFYLRKKDYTKAEKYLDYFSEYDPMKSYYQGRLLQKQGKIKEAYEKYENIIFSGFSTLNFVLSTMAGLALRENDIGYARFLSGKVQAVAHILEMGKYNEYSPMLDIVCAGKDVEGTYKVVKHLLDNVGTMYDFRKSGLYKHMKFRDIDEAILDGVKEKLLEGFRNEEEFGYMAGYEPWEKLIFDR